MMTGRRVLTVAAAALLAAGLSSRGVAEPEAGSGVVLTVDGEVARALKLTAADLAKLPRKRVEGTEHGGTKAVFEGPALVDVLKEAGVKFGEDLRGPNLALYLVVEAADGYRAVFALPELDPAFNDRQVILADRREGAALDAKHGPLQVVIPDEKRQARWVRQVVALRVKRA